MNYRRLGKTDLQVSVISIGCSGFWGQRRFSEDKAHKIILEAFDQGVNFFDTGHNYCNFNAEPRLGKVLRKILTRQDRSRLVISSKAGTVVPSAPLPFTRQVEQKDFSPDAIEASCVASITNLHCDYLDIFYLHGVSHLEITDTLLRRLQSMKSNGLYRYLGINTHAEVDMQFVARFPGIFDVALIDYNVLQIDREPIIEGLHQSGVGVVAGTVLAQGHLIKGKIGSLGTSADVWYLARALLKVTGRRLAASSREMRDVMSSISGMSSVQAAIAYVLGNPFIASCTLGTTKLANLTEILSAVGKAIPDSGLNAIRGAYARMPASVSM